MSKKAGGGLLAAAVLTLIVGYLFLDVVLDARSDATNTTLHPDLTVKEKKLADRGVYIYVLIVLAVAVAFAWFGIRNLAQG